MCFSVLLISLCLIHASAYSGNGNITVYITVSGSHYHDGDCGSLWNSKIEISLENAIIEGYTRCRRCSPPVYTGTAKPQNSKDNYDSNRTSPSSTTRSDRTTENSNISQTKSRKNDHEGIVVYIIISIIASYFITFAFEKFFWGEGCLSFFLLYFPIVSSFITAFGSIFYDWKILFLLLSLSLLAVVFCILFIMYRIQNTKNKKLAEEKKRLEEQKLAEAKRAKEKEFYTSLLMLKQKSDILLRFISCKKIVAHAEQEICRLMDEHSAVMNNARKICITNNGAHYGDLATVYYSPRSKAYHRRSCMYRGTAYAHILSPPLGKNPCAHCRPDLIDTSWMKKCLQIQSSVASYQLFANSDPVFSQPHIAHSCIQKIDILSSLIQTKDQQEMRIALQSKSGMTVWVPEGKVAQYKNGTLPEWSKEEKERMIREIVERVYGNSDS